MPTKNQLPLAPSDLPLERMVLGALMLSPEQLNAVLPAMSASDFSTEGHRAIYATMRRMYEAGITVDRVTLIRALMDSDDLERAGGFGYLTDLDNGLPELLHLDEYIARLQELATKRHALELVMQIENRITEPGENTAEILAWANKAIAELGSAASHGWSLPGEIIRDFPGGLQAFLVPNRGGSGLTTPWEGLNTATCGLQPGDLVIVAGRPSMGKAQPLDAPVLTPFGWKCMGSLKTGDVVSSIDGTQSEVIAVHPQNGPQQIYRLTFSDGRQAECTAEHLWTIRSRYWKADRTVSTAEVIKLLRSKRHAGRLKVITAAAEFAPKQLPIDPWLLGVMIANGSLCNHLSITTADQPTVDRITATISPEYSLTRIGEYGYSLVISGGPHQAGTSGVIPNRYQESLKSLGLWGTFCETKFIPKQYLEASKEQRKELLRGLMDTDGTVESCGTLRYTTVSAQLAKDVAYLARSLGALCSCTSRYPKFTHGGATKEGQLAFTLTIRHAEAGEFVYLQRKKQRTAGRRYQPTLTITSVEESRVSPAQCITVSHPSGLYFTSDFTVTHNSIIAMQLAHHAADNRVPTAVFSLEMSKESLVRRLVSTTSRIDHGRLRGGFLDKDERFRGTRAASDLSELPLYIDDTGCSTIAMQSAALRRLPQKPGLIVIDYLQLMSTTGRAENRNQELSVITRSCKKFATEYNCPVVLLSQLNRECEKESRRPQLSDLRDSGSIEQDADIVAFIHRWEQYQKFADRPEHRGTAELILAKQRNGPTCKLNMVFQKHQQRFDTAANISESD